MGAAAMLICLSAVAHDPFPDVAIDRVDLIEINHFYDEKGRLVFDQVIFYDWCPGESRYHVRDWRLLKKPNQVPHRTPEDESFVTVWHDGDVLRKVSTSTVQETWTQYDPELAEREFLPKDRRRKLCEVVLTRPNR